MTEDCRYFDTEYVIQLCCNETERCDFISQHKYNGAGWRRIAELICDERGMVKTPEIIKSEENRIRKNVMRFRKKRALQ